MEITYTVTKTATKIADVPNDAVIVQVNGRECVGRCEACKKPITDDEYYGQYADGVVICGGCGP